MYNITRQIIKYSAARLRSILLREEVIARSASEQAPRRLPPSRAVITWVILITLLGNNIALGQIHYTAKTNPIVAEGYTFSSFEHNLSIPNHIGSIKEIWNPPFTKPPVWIIQDSHANLTAQKNIIKILQIIEKGDSPLRGQSPFSIGIEGAKGIVDTGLISAIPNEGYRRYIADNLLEKSELTGAEYYAGILNHNAKLYGIEDPGLYFQNLRQFRRAVKEKKLLQPYLAERRRQLEAQTNLLNDKQQRFLDKFISFHEEKIPLSDYISSLDHLYGKTLTLYKACLKLEAELDLEKVDSEHKRLLDILGEQDISIQFRLGRISPLEYYSFIAEQEWPDKDNYKELTKYTELIQLQARIDKNGLEKELKSVEKEYIRKLFPDDKLIREWKNFFFINKLLELRLTPQEAVKPSAIKSSNAKKFYKTALKRDRTLLKKFLKFVYSDETPSALIIGGFHSDGIAKRLRQRGIPYVIVSPKMAAEDRSAYQDLLFNHKDTLDKILSHTGRRLAPILRLPHEMSLPAQIKVLIDKIGVMQVVLEVSYSPLLERIYQLSRQLIKAIEDEDKEGEDHLHRQLIKTQDILRKELRSYIERFIELGCAGANIALLRDKLDVDFQDASFDKDKITIHIKVSGLDIYVSTEEEKKKVGKTFQHLLMDRLGPLLIKEYSLMPPSAKALEFLVSYRDSIKENTELRQELDKIINILNVDPNYLGQRIGSLGKPKNEFIDMVFKIARKGNLLKSSRKVRKVKLAEVLAGVLNLPKRKREFLIQAVRLNKIHEIPPKLEYLRHIIEFINTIDTICDAYRKDILKTPYRGSDFPMFIIRELEGNKFKDMDPRIKKRLWLFFGGSLMKKDRVKDDEADRFWKRVKPVQDILNETYPVMDLYHALWQYVFIQYREGRRQESTESLSKDDLAKKIESAKRELTGKGIPVTPEAIANLKNWAVEALRAWMDKTRYAIRQFTWLKGRGNLSVIGQIYFIRGSKLAEDVFDRCREAGQLPHLEKDLGFNAGKNLIEVNLDAKQAEVHPILTAIMKWLADKDGKKDAVEVFYRFLFRHEDLHAEVDKEFHGVGPATSELLVQTRSLSETSQKDLLTIRDLINYILLKKDEIEETLGKDIFYDEELLAYRDILNIYIVCKFYHRISDSEFLALLGRYVESAFPNGDLKIKVKEKPDIKPQAKPKEEPRKVIALPDGEGYKPIGNITAQINGLFYGIKGSDVFNFQDIHTRVVTDPLTAHSNAKEFYNHVVNLDKLGRLPDKIIIHEYGPGNGRFASDFLNEFKRLGESNGTKYYERISYILLDISEKMLKEAVVSIHLWPHRSHIRIIKLDASKKLPFKDKSALLVRFNELYDDLPDTELIQKKGNKFYRIYGRLTLREGPLRKIDGTNITKEEFLTKYWPGGMEKLRELDPIFIEALDWEYDPNPPEIDLDTHPYGNFIKEFTKGFSNITFPINHGAISHLIECMRILNPDGYLQCYDYGFTNPEWISKHPHIQRFSGQPTTFINFALLKMLFEQQSRPLTLETQAEYLSQNTGTPASHEIFYHLKIGPVPVRPVSGEKMGVSAELSILRIDADERDLIGFRQRVPNYAGMDYTVISDNPGGIKHVDGLEVIKSIKERYPALNLNFLLTITTKTRKLEEIKERILAGYKLGVKNFLIVTGDLPGEGPDSIQAIQFLKREQDTPLDIRLGAVENPFTGLSLSERVNRLKKKIDAGADFIITQPVFNLDGFRVWMKKVRKKGLHKLVPIWAGFMPVMDADLLKGLSQKLGISLSPIFFSSDLKEQYKEILKALCSEEGISGIHIMPLKGSNRLAGYAEMIRNHRSQNVIGKFSLDLARKKVQIEALGFEQINRLRIENGPIIYKRNAISSGYPEILLRAPLNSLAAINDLLIFLETLNGKGELDRFNFVIHLYREGDIPPSGIEYELDFNIYDYEGENIGNSFKDYLNELQLEVKVQSFGSTLARGMKPRASTAEAVSPGMPGALAAVNYKIPWWQRALLFIFKFIYPREWFVKGPLFDCIKCGQCILSTTAFMCIMAHCKKQMRNGPCGDLLPDGRCRLGGDCVWDKIHKSLLKWKRYSRWAEKRGLYWLANFFDREPLLRQILAPWDPALRGTSSQLNALRGIVKGIEVTARPRASLNIKIPGSDYLYKELKKRFSKFKREDRQKPDRRAEIYISMLRAISSHHRLTNPDLRTKRDLILEIAAIEKRLKERKKDLVFRQTAHGEIEKLIYKFYEAVYSEDFLFLHRLCRGLTQTTEENAVEIRETVSVEDLIHRTASTHALRQIFSNLTGVDANNLWLAMSNITPIEVLNNVTGVIGEMTIGNHLRETVENINRLVRFNKEDQTHFQNVDWTNLQKIKETLDKIWEKPEDRVVLYLAAILHDYGMLLRNYGTNSHALDGERLLRPLIDTLVQEEIITEEQGQIILALIGGHVLIRVALGYIPSEDIYQGLKDPEVRERFLKCLRVLYFTDCAATPLFQNGSLLNDMAERTIKYTDPEKIKGLDRLRLLSGGKDIKMDDPWLKKLLDRATFDMPTEILLFAQLDPEVLVKFLYYLYGVSKHLDIKPDFKFIVDSNSSDKITKILKKLDYAQIDISLFHTYIDKGQIVVNIKESPDDPKRRELLGLGLAAGLGLGIGSNLFFSACNLLCAQTPKANDNLNSMAEWIRHNSNRTTGLPASHPDDPQFTNWGFLYDHSLASMILAMANDKNNAYKILDYYRRRHSVPTVELNKRKDQNNVVGIMRVLPDLLGRPLKGIINGVDIANDSSDGRGTEWYVDSGPQAWLGIAILQVLSLSTSTGASRPAGEDAPERVLLNFAKEIGEFIIRLQDTDGAIIAGPKGQKTNNLELDRSQLKHTEHNISSYAFLIMLYEVTGDTRYKYSAEKIRNWILNNAYNRESGYLFQGIDYGTPNGIFASDAQVWAILALGIDNIGITKAEKILKAIEEKAVVEVNGIHGMDFTDPKDSGIMAVRGGYKPMISPEWTAGLIMAYYEIADYYKRKGQKEKAGIYKSKADRLKNDVWKLANRSNNRISFPYATLRGVPTGHGWQTPNGTQSMSGTWMGFVERRFNPFKLRKMGQKTKSKHTSNEPIKKYIFAGTVLGFLTQESEDTRMKMLERELDKITQGKSVTFIFDLDDTLITDEGKMPKGALYADRLTYYKAASYNIPQIFRLLRQKGHKIGILTDAGISHTLFSLRLLGIDLKTIDYLMTPYDPIGKGIIRDIARAWGWEELNSLGELEDKLAELGIRIIWHPRDKKVDAFKKLVSEYKPWKVIVCDDKLSELEEISKNQEIVEQLVGVHCKHRFSSLAFNLAVAVGFLNRETASTILNINGYEPDELNPHLYQELLPKAKIEIVEDTEDPMAEYFLGASRKAEVFWEKLWKWLEKGIAVRQLKIIDASTLVNTSTPDTAVSFRSFISGLVYKIISDNKWFNISIVIVNTDPNITKTDILKTIGFEEKQLGKNLQIFDFSKEPDPKTALLKWLEEVKDDYAKITVAYLNTPQPLPIPETKGIRKIPVDPPKDGEFISGTGVLLSVLIDRPEFIETMPEPMKGELKQLLIAENGSLRLPAFKYSKSHLPIEREGKEYNEEGEILLKPTPVMEIDKKTLEELGLPSTDELLKAIRKIISFYQIHGERDPKDYWIQIRKGLKKPLAIRGKTIIIDIDFLKVPTDFLFPFLLHLAGHEGGHSLFVPDHLSSREEEAIILFIDALRFIRHSRKIQNAIIGAFRFLKGLKDTRYIEFLEKLRENPNQDLVKLIKTALGIDTKYLELRIFKNGEAVEEVGGIDELFSSFKYEKVRWSLIVTRKEYRKQTSIKKKIVLFDENGHLITDEGRNGFEIQYTLGLNSIYWRSVFLKTEHQRHGLGTEINKKMDELSMLNAFGDEYPSTNIELVPKKQREGYWEKRGYRRKVDRIALVETDMDTILFEKRLSINKPYLELSQRIVPLLIPHIDPDIVSQNLPKEGIWTGRKYASAELLYFVHQDPSGSVASVILDAILSRIGLESLLTLKDIELTPSEKTLIQVRLKQLNLDAKKQELNDILDSIYLRPQKFNDYLTNAKAAIRLEDFKDKLSQLYLLVDIKRLDKDLARQLIRLRKEGRIAKIIWASTDIADEDEIKDRLYEFSPDLCNIRDLVIAKQAADYITVVKEVLERNSIPLDRLIIITTEENYTAVYKYIGEGLKDVKLSLTAKEFNFLTPYLTQDIISRFKLSKDKYILELDPLAEDPKRLIEDLKKAQENLAESA